MSSLIALIGFFFIANLSFNFSIGIIYGILSAFFQGLNWTLTRVLGTSSKLKWSVVCLWQSIIQLSICAVVLVSVLLFKGKYP